MVRITHYPDNIKILKKQIEYLNNHYLKIGFIGKKAEEKDDNGVRVVDYAFDLDRGKARMPSRPFFRTAVEFSKGRNEIIEEEKEILRLVFQGKLTGRQALLQVGIFIKQQIQKEIMSNNYAPLSEKTKELKTRNKNNILRDSDRMLNSVNFEIFKK